jgi:hypothetical protein
MSTAALALSEPERQVIYQLRLDGLSLREIGTRTGRHWTTVRKAVRADGQQAKLHDVRTMRSAIAHFRFVPPPKRMRLLRVCDAVLAEARDWCRHQQRINAGMLCASVGGLSYDDAMTFLRIFWWVTRPISLRHQVERERHQVRPAPGRCVETHLPDHAWLTERAVREIESIEMVEELP